MVNRFGTDTSPSSGDSSPTIIRKSVVLPAPFGPTRPTFSPGLSWKEASTKRIWRPYCLLMRLNEIMPEGTAYHGVDVSLALVGHREREGCGLGEPPRRDRACVVIARSRESKVPCLLRLHPHAACARRPSGD